MTHQYFADFSNFVAFGDYASIDLRVRVRRMVSGRIVKTLSVSVKLSEYDLARGMYSEVVEALNKCFSDLAQMALDEGYPYLASYIQSNSPEKESSAIMDGNYACTMAYAIGQVMALTHDWNQGFVSWSS